MINIFKVCSKYFVGYRIELCVFGISLLISGAFTFCIPLITSHFIDYLVIGKNEFQLTQYCIMFSLVTLGGLIVGYIVNRIYVKLSANINQAMNKDVIRKAQRIRISEVGEKDVSMIAQQIYTDTQTVTNFCFELIQNGITNILGLIVPLVAICIINYIIVLILLVLIIIYIICYKVFRKCIYETIYTLKEKQVHFFSVIHDQLKKIKFIQTHGINDTFHKRMDAPFNEMLKALLKLQKIQYLYSGLDTFTMSMGQIFLFLFGGGLVISQKMSIGVFTLISSYFSLSVNSIRYFFEIGKQLQNVKVAYDRLQVYIKKEESKWSSKKIDTIDMISLSKVNFSYGDKNVFNYFNAVLKKGTSYAIIGENGSGKTTLIYLIIGLYDNYSGKIQYNGLDLKEIDLLDLRKNKIGVVEQNPELLSDNIYNNIDLYTDKPDIERINDSVKEWFKLGMDIQEINVKENNIDNNLSGGERQKIALMRALYKNPDVLILDEPTSALDTNSKELLINKINEAKIDKIVIMVTHETSIAAICDVVIEIN